MSTLWLCPPTGDRYVYSGDRVMLSIRAPAPWWQEID
jgi:hypothetical protein